MLRKQRQRVAAVFRRVLAAARARPTSEHATDYQSLGDAGDGLEAEYRRIVCQHLERWGVTQSCATVQVQQLHDHRGKEAFVAVVCLTSWERNAVVRVLLGLPLLDKKIRKAVDVSWLADVSVFRGLQLKVAESLHEAPASAELRHLVVSLTGPKETYRRPDPAVQAARG
jgi:hypothetical protein